MAKEKSLVEDALLQMRNLEEAVSQNAKGILASTMKQEIKELVKESIVSEQDDEEIDTEVDMDMDSDEEEMDMDMDSDEDEMEMDIDSDEDEMEMDTDMDMDMGDDEVIDLSDEDSISDEELLKVFMAMGEKDGIIVKKDDDQIHLTDENKDSEYLIQMGESEEEEYEMYESDEEEMEESYEEMDESDDDDIDSIISKVFDEGETVDVDDEEVVYEIEMDSDEEEMSEQEDEENMFGEEDEEEMYEQEDEEMQNESMKPKIGKGAKIGKPSKFSYKTSKGGFKEDMKTGTKGVGMGKVKSTIFNKPVKKETKEGAMMGKGKPSSMFVSGKSKEETKEASRTLGNGSMFRKGGLPKPRAHSKSNISIEEQRNINQVQILREKNEEYRKALNVFRDKLNEVAIFNSNLAYATRLFTEHSTSKQEKINILRRFDGVETIKESKNLYKTIKEELSTKTKGSITESIETRIEKTPASGSASTLIESKTYENPQFLRMKDLMSKIN
jgi:hypothetical protein